MNEYIIENLTKREINIIESSDIEWCPDDMSGDNTDIVNLLKSSPITLQYIFN